MDYKSTKIQWYGNINKLSVLFVLLSIPVILLGVFLWWQFLAVKIIVFIFVGLITLGVFIILLKWVLKLIGIRPKHVPYWDKRLHKLIFTDNKERKYYRVYL